MIKEVKFLAINVKDINNLTTAHRGRSLDLWELLQENCAKLVWLIIVIDRPVRGKAKDKIEFRRLHMASDANHKEFSQRHKKLTQVLVSLLRAKEKKGL